MKISKLFGQTLKDSPKDIENRSAGLLIRAGFIDQTGAGIYTFLPLGYRVMEKIIKILREEMNAIDGQEILMPALHPAALWKSTGRYDLPVAFKTKSHVGPEYVLGLTHEEVAAPIGKKFIKSYKDLPAYLYQIQTKFRDEERAKSGLLRTREFVMKDLYSFHTDDADLELYYDRVKEAYHKIFKRLGLGAKTYLTYASGGDFSKFSHEFQTVSEAGEDTIYVCSKCKIAVNKEIIDEIKVCPECHNEQLEEKKAIEVGNIFKLGTRFSDSFDLSYIDSQGNSKPVVMGSYGIGPARSLGTVAEVLSDDKGLVWPDEIAPYRVYLLAVNEDAQLATDKLYQELVKAGVEVLYDDSSDSAGEKFMRADLFGIPIRLTVSAKTMAEGAVELKRRTEEKSQLISTSEIIEKVKNG